MKVSVCSLNAQGTACRGQGVGDGYQELAACVLAQERLVRLGQSCVYAWGRDVQGGRWEWGFLEHEMRD